MQSRTRPVLASQLRAYRRAARVSAEHFGVGLDDVLSARRRKGRIAQARVLAAYLAVVCFSLSRRQVARIVGRHHWTINAACTAVEDARDEAATDAAISALEERLV